VNGPRAAGWRRALAAMASLGLALAAGAAAGQESAAGTNSADADTPHVLVMLPMPPQHFRPQSDYGGGYSQQAGEMARKRLADELATTHGLHVESEWPMESLGVDCFLMTLAGGRTMQQVLESLAHDQRPAWTQAVHAYHSMGRGDPLYRLQPAASEWHLDEVHRLATGRHVSVAELDSGVDLHHPDLEGQVRASQNFVDDSLYAGESHGTAVAGIIAARADNGIGMAGVAPDARLLALRACWQAPALGRATDAGVSTAVCDTFTLAKALQFALDQRADVINMSLTGPDDRLLSMLLDSALRRGVSVVGAMDPAVSGGGFPASHPGVIAVAAEGGTRAPGDGASVMAPGRDVPTTLPGARWGFVDGSSFAAAHVSGLVALLRQLMPGLSPDALRSMLASPAGGPVASGIDVCAVIARAANACSCGCEVADTGRPVSRH
jgi:subtilisin family serine protease